MKVLVVLVLSLFLLGCGGITGGTTVNSGHYMIEKELVGSSSAQSWGAKSKAEIQNGEIITGLMETKWSDVTGRKKSCNVFYEREGEYCWKGECDGEGEKWKCEGDEGYSTPEGNRINTVEEVMGFAAEKVALVEAGENLGYFEVEGQDELPGIFRAKRGCNEVICFENGKLVYFSQGDRYKKSWKITWLS